jgi:hypothetical protein
VSRAVIRVVNSALNPSIVSNGNHAAGQPVTTHRGRSRRLNRQGGLASIVSVPIDIFAEVSMPFVIQGAHRLTHPDPLPDCVIPQPTGHPLSRTQYQVLSDASHAALGQTHMALCGTEYSRSSRVPATYERTGVRGLDFHQGMYGELYSAP